MASTRSAECTVPRDKLIGITREKLLNTIDEARQKFNNKLPKGRVSNSLTVPANYQFKISNEDTSLLWGEEMVADIDEVLKRWPDRNLLSCCEGLDNGQLTVGVILKTAPDTPQVLTTLSASDRGAETKSLGASGPKEKYNLAHENIRKRLIQMISLEIGRPIALTSAARGSVDNSRFNPLRSDPKLYAWEFSSEYPSFPDSGVSRWSLSQIDDCNTALDEGHLKVKKVGTAEQQDEERVSVHTPEPRNRTARQKRADDTRTLLHNTIVAKLGREIVRRTSSLNQLNPTRDDPDLPNGYWWMFSEHYSNFPDSNQKRLKDWTIDEHEDCHMAIQRGWLTVEVLEQDPTKLQTVEPRSTKSDSPPQSNSPDQPALPTATSSMTLVAIETPGPSSSAVSLVQEPSAAPSPVAPVVSKPKELTFDEQLDQVLAEPLSMLKNAFGTALKGQMESLTEMRKELKEKIEHIDRLGSKVTTLEQEARRLKQGGDKIAQAREEGRAEGQELAMRIMRETDEARKQTELRTHFMQIERAREEGRREGMRLAREEASGDRSDSERLDSTNRHESPDAANNAKLSSSRAPSTPAAEALNNTGSSSMERPNQAPVPNEPTPDSLRRSTRPPRPSAVRGFQAINHEASSSSSSSTPNSTSKRAYDATTTNASSSQKQAADSKISENSSSTDDIYGVSPPLPLQKKQRTVLSAVSSANRKHINEQWKRVAGAWIGGAGRG